MFDDSKLICPVCGSTKFDEKYKKDGCYVCINTPKGEHNGICGTIIGCYCPKCDKLYSEDEFGNNNNVFECKECGKTQWGYTEYKRNRAALLHDLDSSINFFESFNNIF